MMAGPLWPIAISAKKKEKKKNGEEQFSGEWKE